MITRGEDERYKGGGGEDLAQDGHFRHLSMPEKVRSVLIRMRGMLNIVQGSERICSGGNLW